ncbi:MAG: 50S ribosomal protein L13 [Nanoarchaeota archaeon]
MKIIDGKNAVLGRLGAFVAKEALKGEEIVVLNCEQVIITGNRKNIEERWREKREKIGSGQTGPKHSRLSHLIVKRAIRGMLPRASLGRGRQAFKRIKCYSGIPKEFESAKKISLGEETKRKFIEVKEIAK